MSGAGQDMRADPRRAAVDWFVRQRSRVSATALDDFYSWLEASPENAAAYARVEDVWAAAAEVEEEPQVEAQRRVLLDGPDRRRLVRRALAAAFAAAVVGLGGVGLHEAFAPKPLATQSFRTAVGQRATVTLPDGSAVTLNTDTVVRTRADRERRLVYLERGQAFFRVAKDRSRPFVVTAAGRTVTALGTAFDVRVEGRELKVVLVEGKVRVEGVAPPMPAARPAPPVTQATEMAPGSRLVAPDDADWRLMRANVDQETSWLRGQIVFDDRPLGEVVEELNRYSNRKIVVSDQDLARTRISGIFRPGDLYGFARALKVSRLAEVVEESDREVHIASLQ